MRGLKWLADNGFRVSIAGRLRWRENEGEARIGFAGLFEELGLTLDAADPAALVLFPEMEAEEDVPEITEACWGILGKSPTHETPFDTFRRITPMFAQEYEAHREQLLLITRRLIGLGANAR